MLVERYLPLTRSKSDAFGILFSTSVLVAENGKSKVLFGTSQSSSAPWQHDSDHIYEVV